VFLAVVTALPVHAQDTPIRVSADGVMLDFQDADLRLVLAALAEAGGLNVLYGDLPERRITVRTNRPVPVDGILPLLRSLAAANGLLISEDGDFVRLESSETAGPAGQQDAQQQEELRLFVYRLNHARASQVAATLQALFGGGQMGRDAVRGLSRPSLGESLRSQAIPPADPEADPADVEVITQVPGLRAELAGSLHIVPDEATNTLLVRAQAADWAIIEQAIQVVDLRPLQVVIEVVIAEVRRTRDISTGVSFSASRERESGTTEGELSSTRADNEAILRLVRTGTVNVEAALSALSSTGQVRILSRPVIHAQNSQEATILVGAERPFVQVFRSLPTDAAVRDQVVQYRDVATSLTILPTINTDGYVNIQLSQEVNNATSETQFGAPIISTRKATTHLLARDGQTLVIGGLIDRQSDNSRSGIPFLSDIPLIGGLFGSSRNNEATSELFLFLTPHIVNNDADADRMRDEIERGTPLLNELGPIRPVIPPLPLRPDTIPPPVRPDTIPPS
jgi:general secretion pathway protein D